jgi:maltose alpha-D-glucosyltransferase/alpha-amylase
VIPKFARQQRWFAAKDETALGAKVTSWAHLPGPGDGFFIGEVEIELAGEPAQHYFLPLTTNYDDQALAFGWPLLPYTLAQVRRGPRVGALVDAMAVPELAPVALQAMRDGTMLKASDGEIRFWATSAMAEVELEDDLEVKPLGVEQSNSSVRIGQAVIFKAYRRLAPGVQPELEIGRFLVEEAGYHNTPPLLGAIERVGADGESTAFGAAFGFVWNQGDGWAWTIDYLSRTLDDLRLVVTSRSEDDDIPVDLEEPHGMYLAQVRVLGERTAEVHRAFAIPTEDPAFAAEPIGENDLEGWREAVLDQAAAAFRAIRQALTRLEHDDRELADRLLEQESVIADRIGELTGAPVEATKTRVHGDYHLGQVLVAKADFYLLDFEGEPARPLAERRIKTSPMKDVAGMLRSFDYAAETAASRAADVDPATREVISDLARVWRDATVRAFLAGYRSAIGDCSSFPRDRAAAARLGQLFLLEKALYEICYEAANRPTWLRIPMAGVLSLLEDGSAMEFDDGDD